MSQLYVMASREWSFVPREPLVRSSRRLRHRKGMRNDKTQSGEINPARSDPPHFWRTRVTRSVGDFHSAPVRWVFGERPCQECRGTTPSELTWHRGPDQLTRAIRNSRCSFGICANCLIWAATLCQAAVGSCRSAERAAIDKCGNYEARIWKSDYASNTDECCTYLISGSDRNVRMYLRWADVPFAVSPCFELYHVYTITRDLYFARHSRCRDG